MTATAAPISPAGNQHLILHDVSWKLYTQLLREVGNRAIRMTFNEGELEIMSPLPEHEKYKKRIGRMIEIISLESNIPMEPLGSTTFALEDLLKGLEADECYYIQHSAEIRGKKRLNLTIDPPPDLAVEVDITSRSIRREPIYAALGVPEIWRFANSRLAILHLGAKGTYRTASRSKSFPFLPITSFESFLLRLEDEEQTSVLREFRDISSKNANGSDLLQPPAPALRYAGL
jgi:Uma2 family endonuclease